MLKYGGLSPTCGRIRDGYEFGLVSGDLNVFYIDVYIGL